MHTPHVPSIEWRIYYGDGSVVRGESADDWTNAPSSGVQVVALMEPGATGWTCEGEPVDDRQLWTGEDEYDPFGFGVKFGAWLSDAEYFRTWARACRD